MKKALTLKITKAADDLLLSFHLVGPDAKSRERRLESIFPSLVGGRRLACPERSRGVCPNRTTI